MSYVLVFLAVAAADVCWTHYFIETTNKHAVKAAAWSALIVALGAFTTVSYVHERGLIIAAVFGAFAGTWATIRFKK